MEGLRPSSMVAADQSAAGAPAQTNRFGDPQFSLFLDGIAASLVARVTAQLESQLAAKIEAAVNAAVPKAMEKALAGVVVPLDPTATITRAALAEKWGVSEDTIERLVHRQKLRPHPEFERPQRFSLKEVARFVNCEPEGAKFKGR